MSGGPDLSTLVERMLVASAARSGCPVAPGEAETARWASATFVGARHLLTLRGAASARMEEWLLRLPEVDFDLRGHLVADVIVAAVRRDAGELAATIEVLTVEER